MVDYDNIGYMIGRTIAPVIIFMVGFYFAYNFVKRIKNKKSSEVVLNGKNNKIY